MNNLPPRPKHFVTTGKAQHHAEILANRVRKNFRHFSRRYRKQNIDCFRLYDWDIPEVRAVIDWYAGHLVVGEYVRLQTGPEWLPQMAEAVGRALHVPEQRVHLKRRRTGAGEGNPRYSKMGSRGERIKARERDLLFWINCDDFLDTGLFSDHRDTRVLLSQCAAGKDFLNLFAYTGAFTCAAAAGGARSTVTVDRSQTYLDWAKDNLKLNGLWGKQHELVRSDAIRFLVRTYQQGRRFDLAMVDPPSYFKDARKSVSFDVNRDHPELLRNTIKVLRPGATLFFSTNHQRFDPCLTELPVRKIEELTPKTVPEDYRNRHIHRCWRMTV